MDIKIELTKDEVIETIVAHVNERLGLELEGCAISVFGVPEIVTVTYNETV